MAFIITTLAGLSTLIGMIPIYFNIKDTKKLITFALSFSAGVMLAVSIIDLIPEGIHYLQVSNSHFPSILLTLIFITIGILFSNFVDKNLENDQSHSKLYKLGIISMLAIMMHNIPEGIATFISYEKNQSLGITLAISIALHNIPEGISIAIPIFYATKKKSLAFFYTLLSALSEPFGAILAYLFLSRYVTPTIMGLLLSLIAGIMIHISCYELLPNARNYRDKKTLSFAFLLGIIVMFTCIRLLH